MGKTKMECILEMQELVQVWVSLALLTAPMFSREPAAGSVCPL